MEADNTSNEFPRLAEDILAAQRRSGLDVYQFTSDEVTRLIELIETWVSGPRGRRYLVGVSTVPQVLRHKKIPSHSRSTAFWTLRQLCGTFQQLPNTCLVGDGLEISPGIPIAAHVYADLRRGVFRGEAVAVKLLRFAVGDDRAEVAKV